MKRASWLAIVLALFELTSDVCADESLGDQSGPPALDPAATRSIARGLASLRLRQQPDGFFGDESENYPTAQTALAILALRGSGSTTERGPDRVAIRKAADWLLASQRPGGLFAAGDENGRPMYGHGLTVFALAVLLADRPFSDRHAWETALGHGASFTGAAQSVDGGWNYQPNDGDEGSVTVTQLVALRAASALGVAVPDRVIPKADEYLANCQNMDGSMRYSLSSSDQSRPALTAAAIVAWHSGTGRSDRRTANAIEFLDNYFQGTSPLQMPYFEYCQMYAAQAFLVSDDRLFAEHFPSIRDAIVASQLTDGSWSGTVGTTYSTAANLVTLQLPRREIVLFE